MTADEIQKLAVAALEAFNEALSDAESCGHPLNGPGASVRAFKSRQEAWDALATLRDVALRTASAEPSPEVEARGLPVATVHRGGLGRIGKATILVRWEAGAENLPDGDHALYVLADRAAQADARREDGAMLDARRYRKLRRWMTSNVKEGWTQVEQLAAIGCYVDWAAFDETLDELPQCKFGLVAGCPDDNQIAAMNTTKGADHAE